MFGLNTYWQPGIWMCIYYPVRATCIASCSLAPWAGQDAGAGYLVPARTVRTRYGFTGSCVRPAARLPFKYQRLSYTIPASPFFRRAVRARGAPAARALACVR